MEFIMAGIRIVVAAYLAAMFQGKGKVEGAEEKEKETKDVLLRTGIMVGLMYFVFNFFLTAFLLWLKHFAMFAPFFIQDKIWGATYLNYFCWMGGVLI